jgi:hypothetical protein
MGPAISNTPATHRLRCRLRASCRESVIGRQMAARSQSTQRLDRAPPTRKRFAKCAQIGDSPFFALVSTAFSHGAWDRFQASRKSKSGELELPAPRRCSIGAAASADAGAVWVKAFDGTRLRPCRRPNAIGKIKILERSRPISTRPNGQIRDAPNRIRFHQHAAQRHDCFHPGQHTRGRSSTKPTKRVRIGSPPLRIRHRVRLIVTGRRRAGSVAPGIASRI